jgi:hypothetical protein
MKVFVSPAMNAVEEMDLQLPVQSVPITTNVVSSNTTLCDKVCQ